MNRERLAGRNRVRTWQRRLRMEALEDRNLLAAALVDDAYEQNDTRTTARNLGTLTTGVTINNLVQADANDWYRFSSSSRFGTSANVATSFIHAQGDLDLELYNAKGQRLKVSQGITNGESISLSGLSAGTYYIRVYGYRGATNPNYGLTINLGASVQARADDIYENNDTRATATNLGTLTANARLSNLVLADSADWFRFATTAVGTSANSVALSFQNSQGNLALQLYNSAGTLLSTANGNGNSEAVSLAGRAAGTYYARVYSATGAFNSNYSFQINTPTAVAPAAPPTPTSSGYDIQINYTGFTSSQRAIFEQAAARWERVIVGDLPNVMHNGVIIDDLLINASATAIDGVGGTLGQAGYDRTRTSGTRLPYHGSMEFDSADLATMEANGSLLNVIVHEIAHVLGFGTLWQAKGLLAGAGTSDPRFIGTQATAAYNSLFGITSTGVPVENGGGSGTRESHWRESVFNNEILTGYINGGTNLLSRITIASLADLGYTVNIAAADPYTPPGSSASLLAGSNSVSSSLIIGSPSGSEPPARSLSPALVFAYCEARDASRRVRESAASTTSAGHHAAVNDWPAAVDLLFAREADLSCGLVAQGMAAP